MKYTIEGLQQEVLIAWNLDGIDAIILRYVIDFWHSGSMVKIIYKEKEYLWINYQNIIDNLPCINIKNKISLSRRFKKYINCGLMDHYTYKKGGTFSCYRFTEKYDLLILKLKPYDSKVKPPYDSKVKPKDSSIKINTSIKNTKFSNSNELQSFKKYIRDYFKEKSPEYFKTGNDCKRENAAIKKLVETDLIDRFDNQDARIQFFDRAAKAFQDICNNGIGKNKFLQGTAYIPSKMFSRGIWVEVIKAMNKNKTTNDYDYSDYDEDD